MKSEINLIIVSQMETMDLRYFVFAAESRSLREAAGKAFVTASTISKAVKRLEDQIEASLFDRQGKQMTLNQRGGTLLTKAHIWLSEMDSFRENSGGVRHQLRIVGPELFLGVKAISFLEAENQGPRSKHIQFTPMKATEAINALWSHRCEVAMVHKAPEIPMSSLNLPAHMAFEVSREPYVTAVCKNHALAPRTGIPIQEILEHRFALPKAEQNTPLGFASVDGWNDADHPRLYRIEELTGLLMVQLVQSGQALAYVPRSAAAFYDWRVLDIANCKHSCEVELVVMANQKRTLERYHSL